MADVAHVTVKVLAWQYFDRWCTRCLVTAMHVTVYMEVSRDRMCKVTCLRCHEGEQ